MSSTNPPAEPRRRFPVRRILIVSTTAVLGVAAVVCWIADASDAAAESPAPAVAKASESGEADGAQVVTLPRSAWEVAGVEIELAAVASLAEAVRVTGRVTLNEDRIAHVYPLVEGRVDEVLVRFGQKVKAGEVLAVIQSKEVGQRKLELVQSRLAREIAAVNRDRAAEINRNAQDLITALERGASVEEIETAFRGRSIGDYREKLVTAYAALGKATADYDRLAELTDRGVTAEKDLTSARAARDAARATFTAFLEQSKFDAKREAVVAEQALREAETRVAAGEAALAILGYSADDLKEIDPAKEGETLSHYPVVAPFDGTILTKDITLLESVGPDRQLFEIADLSTVWIAADVYERHLPALDGLAGETVMVRSETVPGLTAEAVVFFTGETVEEATRTVRMRAAAKNADGRLKPGMFVQVELPGVATRGVVQIPEAAVVDHDGQAFVFVHTGDETFERRDVTPGRRIDGRVEIVEGLEPGEPVAVGGAFALKSRLLADLMAED